MKLKAIALPNVGKVGNVTSTSSLAWEFIRRLEAYATHYGFSFTGSGYRDIYAQAEAWLRSQQAGTKTVAFPGNSWHNCGCAYDVHKLSTGKYPGSMEADFLVAPAQQQLARWGLCLSLWKGSGVPEPWHVTPIETLGIPGDDRQMWLDEDDKLNTASGYRVLKLIELPNWGDRPACRMKGKDVQRFQRAVRIADDGVFGEDSDKAAKAMQAAYKLEVDGKIGPASWKIVESLLTPPPDYKALFENAKAQIDILNGQLAEITTARNRLEKELGAIKPIIAQLIPYAT
jgi:peptidoglycan hydrolase-like protein with peptidoglycan-binding domain